MSPEEAVLQLELVGHDFFVFRNAEIERGQRRLPPSRRQLRADRADAVDGTVPAAQAAARAACARGRTRRTAPTVPEPVDVGPPALGVAGHPRRAAAAAQWDAVVTAEAPELVGDEASFVVLADGCAARRRRGARAARRAARRRARRRGRARRTAPRPCAGDGQVWAVGGAADRGARAPGTSTARSSS